MLLANYNAPSSSGVRTAELYQRGGGRIMTGTKSQAGHRRFRVSGLITAVGAVMMLLAIGSLGCGGGSSNSFVAPFAGVWVANSAPPTNVLHFPGAVFHSGGTFASAPRPLLTTPLVFPQDT